jgi:hypothetical protein
MKRSHSFFLWVLLDGWPGPGLKWLWYAQLLAWLLSLPATKPTQARSRVPPRNTRRPSLSPPRNKLQPRSGSGSVIGSGPGADMDRPAA